MPSPNKVGGGFMRAMRAIKIREVFFALVGTGILYQEFVLTKSAQPIAVGTALFLYGLIPAGRADETRADQSRHISFRSLLLSWLLQGQDPANVKSELGISGGGDSVEPENGAGSAPASGGRKKKRASDHQ